VDDDRDTTESLRLLLTLWGHDARSANDGPSSLALVPTFRPDVVLIDLAMPGMNGLDLTRRLRRMPETQSAKIYAVSGYSRPEDVAAALASGCDQHFTKPLALDELERLFGVRSLP
jgi:two-component system CheB/CheR fusion protein